MSLRGGLRRDSAEIPSKQSPVKQNQLLNPFLSDPEEIASGYRPRNDMILA
jgi:hypothetical protein